MIWLVLSIAADFAFVQFFKVGQRRGYHSPTVVSTNYLVVGASLMIYLVATEQLIVPTGALVTGFATGCVFVASLVLMTRMLERAPVGAVFTAFRMSVAVPVVFGVLLWQEPLAPGQMAGIGLAILSLVMMTSGMDATRHIPGWKIVGLLLAVFLLQGLSHSCLRSVHYNGLDDSSVQIIMVTGGTAGALGWIGIGLFRRRPRRGELQLGAFIGVYNALALCIILIALSELPGTLFFPVVGCSVVLLDNLTAHFFWRERLNRTAAAGVVVAALAIFLVV